MNFLYIGQYSEGTTSKMRADTLIKILNPETHQIIDTNIPFLGANKVFRSLGFRYKKGPLIPKINDYITNNLKSDYDLIWVDKAIFITPKVTKLLKSITAKLVHFTPDPAFTYHQSKLFYKSLPSYDYAVTTKSYELKHFYKYLSKSKVVYTTQGFDKSLHQPLVPFKNKIKGVLFIGHYEKERATVIQQLINNNIAVGLAGIKWNSFVQKNKNNKHLCYLGNGIYGAEYIKTISRYQFSWGAISKWIPELHTTRTFEIPACKTILITERNTETTSFFKEDEALFYSNPNEMIAKIKAFQEDFKSMEQLAEKGYQRVLKDGYDYENILREVLREIM